MCVTGSSTKRTCRASSRRSSRATSAAACLKATYSRAGWNTCTAELLSTVTANRRLSSVLARSVAPVPPPTITTFFIGSPLHNAHEDDLVPCLGRPRTHVGLDAGVGGPQLDLITDLRAPVCDRQVGDRPGARGAPRIDDRPHSLVRSHGGAPQMKSVWPCSARWRKVAAPTTSSTRSLKSSFPSPSTPAIIEHA